MSELKWFWCQQEGDSTRVQVPMQTASERSVQGTSQQPSEKLSDQIPYSQWVNAPETRLIWPTWPKSHDNESHTDGKTLGNMYESTPRTDPRANTTPHVLVTR